MDEIEPARTSQRYSQQEKCKYIPEWRIVHCDIADENTIALIHRERDRPNEARVGLPVISQHVSELLNL